MNTGDYQYLPSSKVQCPKCGNLCEIAVGSNAGYTLEYAGICQNRLETGGTCSTTLVLHVTSHLFPLRDN